MKNSEKGVSLIITFFVMVIVLAVILSVSALLYSEIKIIKNIGDSVIAFYAADSGAEKLLYFDRQVLPLGAGGQAIGRGFCSIFESCLGDQSPNESQNEKSMRCNKVGEPEPLDAEGLGCNYNKCNNCRISFNTAFNNKSYNVVATVRPSDDGKSVDLLIDSRGSFKGTARQINIKSTKATVSELITIENACVNPKSTPEGQEITISANVSSNLGNEDVIISNVKAVIKNYFGVIVAEIELPQKTGTYSNGCYAETWSTNQTGVYNVDIVATNSAVPPNTATVTIDENSCQSACYAP